LLNNAAKYTEAGGHIWLTATREEDEAILRVRDTGIGIPREMLSAVFELFSQVDHSLDRSEGGLGIGLTLVRRLVEMHHGTVQAQSAGAGQGSEFVVRLPVLKEGQLSGALTNGENSTAVPVRRGILVVDDNQDAADSLALLLRLSGHEVRTCHDGPTALRLAAEANPEVVVLDIGLPGMSGYEVARHLRQQDGPAQVLLIALTGYGQAEDERRSRAAGFDHHLTKPVDPERLRDLLTRARPDAPRMARAPSA
jgi:CheY-like chemotaxis protein